jgi:hypothetical protein
VSGLQARASLAGARTLFRTGEWWDGKLAPIFGGVYAAAYLSHATVSRLILPLLYVLPVVVTGGIWAHVLNDLADERSDALAGKKNRMAGRSVRFKVGIVAGCLIAGFALSIPLWHAPFALAIYIATYAVWTVYSLPPLRLKGRGLFGALADATGAYLLPQAFAVAIVGYVADWSPPRLWFACLLVHAFTAGLRSITWHELLDIEGDRRAGVVTWAVRQTDPTALPRIFRFVLFPVEALALLGLLVCAGNPIAFGLLLVYGLTAVLRVRFLDLAMSVMRPGPTARLLLFEFYELFYPWAFLLAITVREPRAGLPLCLAHALVFPRSWRLLRQEAWHALRWGLYPRLFPPGGRS